jgi:hypothetical protein
MRLPALLKSLLALSASLALLALSSTNGQSASGSPATVIITSVSGYAGHAFVLAEVTTGNLVAPAPTGTTHQSPYFAEWVRVAIGSSNCPWIWAVYVFNRSTNLQVNPTSPGTGTPDFGTTTLVCASPGSTPVDLGPVPEATARLDLDLAVKVSPPLAVAGSRSVLSAALSAALTNDLNLYLNMAIEDWSVTGWFVDFGDGQTMTIDSKSQASVSVPHIYQSAGQFDARVIAYVSGHAQAAIYGRYGRPHLIQQSFSVEVGNSTMALTRAGSVKRYVGPKALVTVTPSLDASAPSDATGFRRIDALRGVLTSMAVHALVLQEGVMVVDGRVAGIGTSRLVAWRLDGSQSDAPAGSGTAPGRIHGAQDALRLQWNAPDRFGSGQAQDYVVAMTLYIETRYPDGHTITYVLPSSFSVSVNFAAETG